MLDIRYDDHGAPVRDEQTRSMQHRGGRVDSAAARPAIFVRRFCGLEPSSLRAALRDGVSVLTAFAKRYPIETKGAIVVCRNRRATTVTLDIGLLLRLPLV